MLLLTVFVYEKPPFSAVCFALDNILAVNVLGEGAGWGAVRGGYYGQNWRLKNPKPKVSNTRCCESVRLGLSNAKFCRLTLHFSQPQGARFATH